MKINKIIIISITLILLLTSCNSLKFKRTKITQKLEYLKKAKPNLTYDTLIPEPVFKNLNMLGDVKRTGVHGQRNYGMILRSLRFKNITEKVEKKYGLPKNILLAMVMQESGGVDLLPNSRDDGGLGLCHMQPSVAKEFGLKIYHNCNKLVSIKHGKALRRLIAENKFDRKKLIKYDDRFHPILNIDAAGRMLAYYGNKKQIKETQLKTAIYRYAGARNYEVYYKRLLIYKKRIEDEHLIDKVRKEFNKNNPKFTINKKKGNFDDYINAHQKQNINYGLNKY